MSCGTEAFSSPKTELHFRNIVKRQQSVLNIL